MRDVRVPARWFYYLGAVFLVLGALSLQLALFPRLGVRTTYLLFNPAVAIAALWGGLGPGLVATVLADALIGYYLIPPAATFAIDNPANLIGMAIFFATGVMVSIICEVMHRSASRTEAAVAKIAGAQEREARFRALTTATSDVVYRMSPDWSTMWQLHSRELLANTEGPNKTWLEDYIPQEEQPRVTAAIQAAIRTKSVFELEHQVRRVDGAIGWASSRAIPVMDPDGTIIEWFGAASDITGRKQTEEALAQSERLLRFHVENTPLAVIEWGADRRVTRWSRGAERIFGWKAEEIVGKGYQDFRWVYEEDLERFVAIVTDLLSGSTTQAVARSRNYRKNGAVVWCDWYSSASFDSTGRFQSCLSLILDVTNQQEAEESLKEAGRRKDQFLATLAHELRNPMAAVGAAAALLRRPGATLDAQELARGVIEERTKQLARLVEDLLDVSRLTTGKMELRKENVDFEDPIAQAVEATRGCFEARKQKLNVNVAGPLPVFGDPIRLEQIVTNLLTNASRYSEQAQEVRLHAVQEGREAIIRVVDNGIGISADLLPRIFEPFDAQKEHLHTRGGLGLGLTLVKRLCDLHGATITAKSAGYGKGSEFEVRLPLRESSGTIDAQRTHAAAARPLQILMVEDQIETAALQAAILEHEGHTVRVAHDGPQAVEMGLGMKPDVVLVDLGLPGFDGYEVAARLRKAGLADVLIIAITGYGQPRDILRGRQAGIDYHLVKPVRYEELFALLAKHREPGEGVCNA